MAVISVALEFLNRKNSKYFYLLTYLLKTQDKRTNNQIFVQYDSSNSCSKSETCTQSVGTRVYVNRINICPVCESTRSPVSFGYRANNTIKYKSAHRINVTQLTRALQ